MANTRTINPAVLSTENTFVFGAAKVTLPLNALPKEPSLEVHLTWLDDEGETHFHNGYIINPYAHSADDLLKEALSMIPSNIANSWVHVEIASDLYLGNHTIPGASGRLIADREWTF